MLGRGIFLYKKTFKTLMIFMDSCFFFLKNVELFYLLFFFFLFPLFYFKLCQFGESAKNNNKKSFLFPLCSSLATITSEVEF
jgi:hypothetical protein